MQEWWILADTSTAQIWAFWPEILVLLLPLSAPIPKAVWNWIRRRCERLKTTRRDLSTPSEPSGLRGALRSASHLRPVSGTDPEQIRRLRRVPLEYNLGISRLTDILVYIRAFFLRPTYPKPAFAVTRFEIVPESVLVHQQQDADHQHAFTPGGYRLYVWLDPGESRRHFMRSMRAGTLTGERTIVVCSPEELAHPWNPVRRFNVYAPPKKSKALPFPCLVLYSRDPLFSGMSHEEYRTPTSVSNRAIWLVDVGPRGAEQGEAQSDEESRGSPALPKQFPVPLWRRFVYLLTVVVAVLLVIRFVLVVNFSIGGPIGLEWYDGPAIATFAFLTALTIEYLLWHALPEYLLARYGEISWRRGRGEQGSGRCRCFRWLQSTGKWTATTTRCIADGFTVRNRAPNPSKQLEGLPMHLDASKTPEAIR